MGIGRGRWWGYRFFDGVGGEREIVYKSSGIFGATMGTYDPWWILTQLRSILAGLHLSGIFRAAYTWMYYLEVILQRAEG